MLTCASVAVQIPGSTLRVEVRGQPQMPGSLLSTLFSRWVLSSSLLHTASYLAWEVPGVCLSPPPAAHIMASSLMWVLENNPSSHTRVASPLPTEPFLQPCTCFVNIILPRTCVCARHCLMALVTLQLWWRSQTRLLYVEKWIRYEGISESTVQCCLRYNTNLSIIQLRQFTCSTWEGSVRQSSFKFTLTLFKCGLHAAAHRPKHYRFFSPNVIHKSKLIAAKHKFSQIFNVLH